MDKVLRRLLKGTIVVAMVLTVICTGSVVAKAGT